MTENSTPTYRVHEFQVSDRNLLDAALDAFQPGWRNQPDSVESGSLAFVADSATFTLGLYDDADTPIGFSFGYRLRLPTGPKSMLVHDIQIRPQDRQQGLGRQLLKNILQLAKHEGHRHVWGVVEADNEAAHKLARSAGATSSGNPHGDVVYEWRFETGNNSGPRQNDRVTGQVSAVEQIPQSDNQRR